MLIRVGTNLINLEHIVNIEKDARENMFIYLTGQEKALFIGISDPQYAELHEYLFEMPSHEKVFEISKLVNQTENLYSLWKLEDEIMEENNKLKIKQLESRLVELKKVNAGIEKYGFEKYFTEIRPREENGVPNIHPGMLN
jgi:predicted nucleotidyltransferase component of viral defense system